MRIYLAPQSLNRYPCSCGDRWCGPAGQHL